MDEPPMNKPFMNVHELIAKYSLDLQYSEDCMMEEIRHNIDFIDFSTGYVFDGPEFNRRSLIDVVYFHRYCGVLEFLLGKCHELDPNSLNEERYKYNKLWPPRICHLLCNSIYIGNYDFVEICLRFISDDNLRNGIHDELFLDIAINRCNEMENYNRDIIDLLRMHGAR